MLELPAPATAYTLSRLSKRYRQEAGDERDEARDDLRVNTECWRAYERLRATRLRAMKAGGASTWW
jgi:hypothetical protein